MSIGSGRERGARARDLDEFETFYQDQYARVRAFVARRVPDEDVDDVVADVFLAAWRRIVHLPSDPQLQAVWALRSANFAVLNQQRSRRRRRALAEREHRESRLRMSLGNLEDIGIEGLDPSSVDGRIEQVFAELPNVDRFVLTLTAWDDCSIDQLAAILDCSPGAAKTRLSRARARFRKQVVGGGT